MSGHGGGVRSDQHTDPDIFGYVIHEEIARGGQGVVYRAVQGTTGREVAIKVLGPEVSAASQQARERMAREIEIVGSLNHPGIVRVFDSVKLHDGRDALVMELIEGVPLCDWLGLGSRPSETACLELLARVAETTHYAHQHGVIHRDLKPSNILIDQSGMPRLLDFGVAHRTGIDGIDPRITRTGEFSGTLAYAAPEQLSKSLGAPDVRTDVYALGVIGFEMLTGRAPYPVDGSLEGVIERIMTCDPPTRGGSGISCDAWTVLAKAVSKDKSRRYQSAADMARDLGSAARGDAVQARGDSRWYRVRKSARRHRVGLSIGVIAVLGIVGVLFSLFIGTTRLDDALRQSRLIQIHAQLAVGAREQAELVFWDETKRDLPPGTDASRALWGGSRRERELLWCFAEMQAHAMCLDILPAAFSPTVGVGALPDNTVITALPDGALVRLDPSDIRSPESLGIRVPDEAVTVKFVPSGRFIVCVGHERIWTISTADGRTLASTPFDAKDFLAIGLGYCDWGIVTNDVSGNIRVHTLPELELLWSVSGMPSPQTPWLHQERRIVAYITNEGTVRVIDLDRGSEIAPSGLSIPGERRLGPSPQLLLSPDLSEYIVAYGGGMIARSVSQNTDTGPLLDHPGYRVWVGQDPGWGMISAVANRDPTLHLWDTETWKPLAGLSGHEGSILSHAFLQDGSRIITVDLSGTMRVWAAPGRGWRHALGPETTMAHQIAAHADSGIIYATDNGGLVSRLTLGEPPRRIASGLVAVRAAIDDKHSYLAVCDLDRGVEIHDLRRPGVPGSVRTLALGTAESISALRFRPRAPTPRLALAAHPPKLVLADPVAGEVTRLIDVPTSASISELAWSPDGRHVALALRDGSIAYLDDPDTSEFRVIEIGSHQIRSLAFTPDSESIAAVGDSGFLYLVNARTGRVRTSRRLSEHSLFCVVVHQSGHVALVGDRAGVLKAVDLSGMRELATFNAGGSVMSLAFTDSGQSLAVSALDRPIELWRYTELEDTFERLRDAMEGSD